MATTRRCGGTLHTAAGESITPKEPDLTQERGWNRRQPTRLGQLAVIAAVAAVGAAVGAWVNLTWWNPVYGVQLIALAGAFLVAGCGLLISRQRRAGAVAASSIALVAGMVGGMVLVSRPALTESVGTMTLRLERPVQLYDSGPASCVVGASGEQMSVSRDVGRLPVDGRPILNLTVTVGDMLAMGNERRDDGLELWLGIEYPNEPRGGELVSTRDSVLQGRSEGASGSLRFSNLDASSYGGGPPEPLDPNLEGTVEWICPRE